MSIVDKELAALITAEFEASSANITEDTVEEAAVEEMQPRDPFELDVPAAWASSVMFSDVFGEVPGGKRDLPVPKFQPTDWPEEARAMIPSLPDHWVHNLDVMYGIAVAVYTGDTTLLTGPTGTGKTSSLVAFAAECGIPVWITSCYGRMEHTDFVGSASLRADEETGANITEYNPTQMINSLRYGGFNVIDEAFRSPTLMTIQSLLEDKHTIVLADADGLDESERVLVAPEGKWWVFLTDNTTGTGDHTGSYTAEVQDLSTLDRITSTIHVDYNPPVVEQDIVKRAVGWLTDDEARNLVEVAGLVRAAYMRNAVLQTMSMRALLSWARKFAITGDRKDAFERAFACKLDPTSRGVVSEVYLQVYGETLD